MIEHTQRRNVNRGYMKLNVWQKAIDLFTLINATTRSSNPIDLKLRSQLWNSSQSISANIAEGYGRNSPNDYLRFLYIALGSLAETMSRCIGLKSTNQISSDQFEAIDALHYEVENKLLALIKSVEAKKDDPSWECRLSESIEVYAP